MKLWEFTGHELLEKLAHQEITQEEILGALDKRREEVEPEVKAFVRIEKASAPWNLPGPRVEAEGFQGLPIAIKDNICIQGHPATCASRILEGFRPPYDATVIQKLKAAGFTIYGQTNMDEFAFGSSCENSCYFPTRNPWNLECVPGGSSGGSAAAVACGEAIWALGSDTGGSIRQPASFCGVVGLKPTYGRVSRYGLIAFASSLDQIGPFARDIEDCCILLKVIAGYDPNDSTSANLSVPDFLFSLGKDIKGIKIGVPKEYFSLSENRTLKGIAQEVKQAVVEAIEQLKKLGAKVQEVSLPHTEYAVSVYYILATAEASSNLARFDGVQYGLRAQPLRAGAGRAEAVDNLIEMYKRTRQAGFGNEAKRRIMLGTYVLSHGYYEAYYLRALKARALIVNDFADVFKDFDCIVAPTSPTPAFKLREKMQEPLAMYLSDIYTISVNLAGLPAVSIPCGFSSGGLPIGLQIIAKSFDEEMLFRVAHCYEQATAWHKMKPEL